MRWFWIDRFVEFRSGESAKAIKNVSLAEEQLHDHFPGYPVMPASLIIEGLAQTGGILVGEAGGFAEKVTTLDTSALFPILARDQQGRPSRCEWLSMARRAVRQGHGACADAWTRLAAAVSAPDRR